MRATLRWLMALPFLAVHGLGAGEVEILPGTAPLVWEEADLSGRLMDGAHAFVERQMVEARPGRAAHWQRDTSSPEAYERSVAPNRESFRRMLGLVEPRVSPVLVERFGTGETPGLVARTDAFRIWQVRWPVLDGVWGEGLWMEPLAAVAAPLVVVIPDAHQLPEDLAGLTDGDPAGRSRVRGLVEAGFTVVVPAILDRAPHRGGPGDDARLKSGAISHREWIHRQAFHLGRHLIGYELHRVLALVDAFRADHPEAPVGVAGSGEGGLLALYAGACDTRIGATLCGGYFQSRERTWAEPLDRNLFGQLNEFGDAEISSLIPPRALLVDDTSGPPIETAKGSFTHVPDEEFLRFGIRPGAAAAALTSSDWTFPFANRARVKLAPGAAQLFFADPAATTARPALLAGSHTPPPPLLADARAGFSPEARHQRLFQQLDDHVQKLVRAADRVREESFLYRAEPLLRPGRWSTERFHPTLDPARFIENCKPLREQFAREAMGRFDEPPVPPRPRTRKVAEGPDWVAWDVVLDVYDGFFAWGTLVLPKDLKPGERRPVVVCQHGRHGLPRDTIDAGKSGYANVAAVLAGRGFITLAPHNLYRGEERYRWLNRKANTVGCTLFSFIIPSHRALLDWLKTLPQVDGSRIGFYGLSYGGETAVRVPPLLEDYTAVICAGDFNQWTRKVAAADFPNGFLASDEWEMPYWNLGSTFDYAEMVALIFPRPFMVERGHHDLVSTDAWVAHEYAKVRRLYAQFGLAERTEIEFFQGGHAMRAEGTFRFLHRHLKWPERR